MKCSLKYAKSWKVLRQSSLHAIKIQPKIRHYFPKISPKTVAGGNKFFAFGRASQNKEALKYFLAAHLMKV